MEQVYSHSSLVKLHKLKENIYFTIAVTLSMLSGLSLIKVTEEIPFLIHLHNSSRNKSVRS